MPNSSNLVKNSSRDGIGCFEGSNTFDCKFGTSFVNWIHLRWNSEKNVIALGFEFETIIGMDVLGFPLTLSDYEKIGKSGGWVSVEPWI
jgi:hypothetical protein